MAAPPERPALQALPLEEVRLSQSSFGSNKASQPAAGWRAGLPRSLHYRKGRRRSQGLVTQLVVDLHLQHILPRFQFVEVQELFNSNLLRVDAFQLIDLFAELVDLLVAAGLDYFVVDCAAGLVRLFVRAEVVKLQVNPHLFVALE